MKIYGLPLSTYCAKVQVALRHKGVDYEMLAPPDGYASDAYRQIVPMGTIPGMVHDDVVLSESEAINEYIEELWPEPTMLYGGPQGRAHIRTLSRIHDTWIEPNIRALYPQVKSDDRDLDLCHERIDQFHRRLEEFASQATPDPYIAGKQLSLADCAWPTTFVHAEMLFRVFDRELELPQKLLSWRDTLDKDPAVEPVLAACRSSMVDWMQNLGLLEQ